jgi:phospholipid transport system substrate-binding protein
MAYFGCAVIIIVYWWFAISAAGAGEPLDLVKSTHERFLQVLQDPMLQSKDKEIEINDRLRDIRMPLIDVDEMAKRVLAKHWTPLTTAEQKEFIEVFRAYLELLNYIPARFASATLVLEREKIEQEFAEVEGYFYFPAARNAPVVYKLRLVDGKWKLYDSSGWGVSSVENLRAQFDRVIAKSSFQGLIKLLREKKESMEKRRATEK